MNALAKGKSGKGRKGAKSDEAYMLQFCEISRRGAMDQLVDMMKGYWTDKKAYPLHRLYKIIEKDWKKSDNEEAAIERILLVRDGLFGALDLLSLSLPLEISGDAIIQQLIKGADWDDGRRRVRSECAKIVNEMISAKKIANILPSGLERDGFGFLIPDLSEALLKDFRMAEPRARKGNVSLARLSRSVLGRRILREQMIADTKLPEGDSRLAALKEAYDRLLVELELDQKVAFPQETHQVTFNGKVAEDEMEYMETIRAAAKPAGIQSELTEYITSTKEAKSKPKKKRKKSSKRRKKNGGA
ncbi:MAG: hypothetical protein ACW975_12050 [Candidatus Thorarchaeota archaeon]|jgi:hypothetical protein